MAGSLSILLMSLPTIPALAPITGQLEYLAKLSQEAHDQPWHLVRTAHREVLLSIEHRDLGLTDFTGRHSAKTPWSASKATAPSSSGIPPVMGPNLNPNNGQL